MDLKAVYIVGSFLECVAGGFLFGLLALVDSAWLFLGISYLLRCGKLPVHSAMVCCETAFSGRFLYGTGESISMWAVLGVAVSQYPDRVATLIGAYGTFFGLGYLGGPVVGSLLYSVGGLALPFELVGAAGFLVTLLAMYSIPSTSKSMEEEEEEDEVDDEKSSEQGQTKSLTMWSTITVGQINYFPGKKAKKTLPLSFSPQSLSISFPLLDNFVLQSAFGFVEAMFEPHGTDAVGMSSLEVGLFFLVISATFVVLTPAVGHVSIGAKCLH